jgi:hypothetical protein
MKTRGYRVVVGSLAAAFAASCAMETGQIEDEVGVDSHAEALELKRACNDKLEDVYKLPKQLGSYDASKRGDIVRCATGRRVETAEISQLMSRLGFAGVTPQYAAQLLRISYRTERPTGQPDVASALVVLPIKPRLADGREIEVQDEFSRRGKRAPLIGFGHGTIPYGNTCAYSRLDPVRGGSIPDDRELALTIALATRGYPVVMSDYTGFLIDAVATPYMDSQGESRPTLDATRAFQKLVPNAPDSVALVGHSQGGHAVLSAQAVARSYGLAGNLLGVAAFAPFWAPARAFGALVSPEFALQTSDPGGAAQIAFATEFFYTAAENYDGRGRGLQLFKPGVRAAAQTFVSTCDYFTSLDSSVLGATAADIFQPDFLNAVAPCGVYGGESCSGGLAGTWAKRFRADRPKLDPNGAPVVMWAGAQDIVIAPAVSKCAIDKLKADLSGSRKFTFCGDAKADHETILSNDAAWVMRWIDARAGIAPEPAACPGESALGTGLMCLTPPGNAD